MHQVANRIMFEIFQLKKGNNSKRIKQSLHQDFDILKNLVEDIEFDNAFDYLFSNRTVRDNFITMNLFPRRIQDVSMYSEATYTDDIRIELRWLLKLISKHSSIITQFIYKKEEYEELVLEGNYKSALLCLKSIEDDYGISFWLLENRILLYHKLDLDVKKDILDEAKNGFLSAILSFYDLKASSELLARDYDYLVRRETSMFKRKYPELVYVIDAYSYFLFPFSFEMTSESITHLLKYIYTLPLIDRYLTVLDIIEQYIVKMPDDEAPVWLKEYSAYLKHINDTSISAVCFILAPIDEKLTDYCFDADILQIRNMFVLGELDRCYECVRNWVENKPLNIYVYNLYIELCQLCGINVEDINVSDNKKNLIINLNEIYTISIKYNDAIDDIYRQCLWSFHAKWARNTYYQVRKLVEPMGSPQSRTATKLLSIQQLSVETAIFNLSKADAVDFLNKTDLSDGNIYRLYQIALLEGDYQKAATICNVEKLSELLNLHGKNTYIQYEGYLSSDNPILYKIRCAEYLWDSMQNVSDYERGIDYFIHLFINREEYVRIAPIAKFMDYARSCDLKYRKHTRISILYYIYTTYFDSTTKDDLSIACEDFLYLNRIDRPSEITEDKIIYFNKEQIIYFLRNICIPQIMGPVLLSIRTSNELEQERISICQNLRHLDPENELLYDQEIKERTHKLFINDGVVTLESHKIQVNTEGIKTRVSKELKSVFIKYMYYRNMKLDHLLDQIKNIEGGEKVTVFSFESSQMFNEIVTTIRNEFVLGAEYGLDAYLSLNIRHGTLPGQLRAPLANMNLLAEKNIENDHYDVARRWLYALISESDKKNARTAIIRFTEETNKIISYLKNELIQISTEEKPTNGIFDYSLTESQISLFQNYLTENCEFDDFIDNVFSDLWKRTEVNLEKMRWVIREDIKQQYNEAFAKLRKTYKSLSIDYPEAIQWIKEAQNDMDAELEKICDWFKRSTEGQYSDFDLDSAFQVGLQTIKNIHPSMKIQVTFLEKTLTEKIDGNAWKYFVSIFYILFDNISKYAKEINGIKNVVCTLRSDKKGIFIKIENSLDCRGDLSEVEKKVNMAMGLIADASYLARAKQEGGSGIPKIYKMLAIDLKLKPHVKCRITEDKKTFQVEIAGDY